MQNLDPHIFRAYDIRGTVPAQLNEEAFRLIGQAFGSLLRERYAVEHPTVAVGRDMRTHSPAFEAALTEGLMSTGCRVLLIGQTPSPVNYFTICSRKLDAGIQITASHNEPEFNGAKLQVREAEAFSGDDLQTLRSRIETGDFLIGEGTQEEIDTITPYKERMLTMFGGIGKGLHIAIDNGNGVTGPVYNTILKELGFELTELYAEPDGTFPNHLADPSQHKTLKELTKTVPDTGVHCGIAFDGDGDRVGFVDEQGAIRSADDILLLLAQDHLQRHPGAPIVFTVSNSSTLETEIAQWGGKPVMCIVGHSFVEHAMREHNALLGGEQSGHFFCGEDYFPYDDAFVAALRVLKICSQERKPFSQLFDAFPKVYQVPELRPHCPDEKKTDVVKRIVKHFQQEGYPVNTLDGARIDFGSGAWAGIRQSNTAPRLSVCMEARSKEQLQEVENIVLAHLKTYPDIRL
ncbi:MAG: phosphomannomutase/phosphoglucomutase [Candidatus Peribacteraceae bacterium]|jgi:phosphomannomutase/phosphoglucomutase